jgi:DNA-directed RNA polymerase specialized sigma24 family protein
MFFLEGQLPMSSPGSVTQWLQQLQAGDKTVAPQLTERYLRRVLGLARTMLPAQPLGIADEEDVAVNALAAFFLGVENGRFPQLHDREDLWQVLVCLTRRRADHLMKYVNARKRQHATNHDGAPPQMGLPDADAEECVWEQLVDPNQPPDIEVLLEDEFQYLLACLEDATLREVAIRRVEGYTNDEIATLLNFSVRTVERKLQLIRSIWKKEGER